MTLENEFLGELQKRTEEKTSRKATLERKFLLETKKRQFATATFSDLKVLTDLFVKYLRLQVEVAKQKGIKIPDTISKQVNLILNVNLENSNERSLRELVVAQSILSEKLDERINKK